MNTCAGAFLYFRDISHRVRASLRVQYDLAQKAGKLGQLERFRAPNVFFVMSTPAISEPSVVRLSHYS